MVLSGRRQLVLVRPGGALLVVHVLHYPAQLRSRAFLEEQLRQVPVGQAERQLAERLIESCSQPVRWADYRDDTAVELAALVKAKLNGRMPQTPTAAEETPVVSLLEALRQSVAAVPAESGAAGRRAKKGTKRTSRRSS